MLLRCQMQTKPGMHAQYDGYVDVRCHNDDDWNDVFYAAVRELRRTAFPDYNASMWTLVSYGRIG